MTKFNVGDRVEVTLAGEVSLVKGDQFEALTPQGVIVRLILPSPGVTVRKVAPRKPEVGEVIDGKRLKATPWRQGTVIASAFNPASTYLLNSRGRWASAIRDTYGFSDWRDSDRVKIVYLP